MDVGLQVEVKTLIVGNEVQEYLPEYRSGGYADQGLRRSMEDAHTCVDNLDDVLGERGAFYGVSKFVSSLCRQCTNYSTTILY